MHSRKPGSLLVGLLTGLIVALLSSASVRAQAWLPPKGEAWLTFGYGNIYSAHHYGTGENPPDPSAGPTRSQTFGLVVGYGITDRLALNVSIPIVDSVYHGSRPHIINGVILTPDDGHYHGYFQDFRINLAYQAMSGTVAIAPFATVVIPSHGYPTLSHAAPGKGLNQVLLGFAAGASLDRIVPGTFAEVYYDYAFVEKVVNINTNRSDFGFQTGYFITPTFGLRFVAAGYYTHGGIAYNTPANLPPELFVHHDQLAKSSIVNVGGGLSYVLTGSTEVSVSYLRSIYGRTGHSIDQGLGFSFTWSFSPEQIIRRAFPPKPMDARIGAR
jgi:hypothetical protein